MVSLGEWANVYLDFCKQKFGRSKYVEKCRAYRFFFRSISPGLSADLLQRGMVMEHFVRLIESGRTGIAVNCDRKNLSTGWKWAVRYMTDFPQGNPFLVDAFPEVHCPRYVPPLADFWAILKCVENEQDRALLLSFLYLAARRSELFRLRVEDVDLDRRRVRLGTRKRAGGGLEFDWVPIADPLYPELVLQLQRVGDGLLVFPCTRKGRGTCAPRAYGQRTDWLPRLCVKAGVKHFTLHAIRHLTASILADQGVPLVQIQQILRHRHLTTTERYVRSLGIARDAVAAIPVPPAEKETVEAL